MILKISKMNILGQEYYLLSLIIIDQRLNFNSKEVKRLYPANFFLGLFFNHSIVKFIKPKQIYLFI